MLYLLYASLHQHFTAVSEVKVLTMIEGLVLRWCKQFFRRTIKLGWHGAIDGEFSIDSEHFLAGYV